MMLDHRAESIKYQLRHVKVLIPVLSVKGGVGKSILAMMLSHVLRDIGKKVGVLDLDFSNPSQYLLFGIEPEKLHIEEEDGYIAPEVYDNVRLSAPAFFTRGGLLPSRERDSIEVLLELLAITNWRDTEVIIIDTPPGLQSEHIELLKTLDSLQIDAKRKAIIVATPYKVTLLNVYKSLDYLKSLFRHDMVLLINKYSGEDIPHFIEEKAKCVIKVPRDELLEERYVDVGQLLNSKAYLVLKETILRREDCLF